MKYGFLTLVVLLFAGCSYTPNNYTAETAQPLPGAFSALNQAEQKLSVDREWWEEFYSPELNRLISELEQNSFSLHEANLRIRQAQLLLEQAQASNLPFVSGRISTRSGRDLDNDYSSNSSSGAISLSYDADIWGSREAQQLFQRLGISAQQYVQRSTALQLQRILAAEYFTLLSLHQRQLIAEKNVDAGQRLYELVKLRYEAGDASGVEVAQQRNTLISAQAELLRINNSLSLSSRIIATLLGRSDMSLQALDDSVLNIRLPEIKLIQPAKILAQRPDVSLAYVQLQQADIGLYQAGIEGLPGLSLSADLAVSDLVDLASGWSISALASAGATLFDGGRIEAGERIARTDVSLALNNVKAVTVDATREILDSIDNYSYQKAAYELDVASLHNNERLYRLAGIRYKSGDTDFLNLLIAQRSWFSAQLAVITRYRDTLAAAVEVYGALGGKPEINEENE